MIPQIRPSELTAWIAQQDGPAVVLDVREPEELEASSIKADGFELVLIPMNDVPARIAELDAARPVAVLCHRGARSQRVATFLAQNGFDNVANIAGGIEAWATERDSSVRHY
jgi:rhodanese-related sulfurtransferase